jgi:hypothetical protein
MGGDFQMSYVTPEKIAADAMYLQTNKHAIVLPIGRKVRILADINDFGVVKPSERAYRFWEKTAEGWKYLGLFTSKP